MSFGQISNAESIIDLLGDFVGRKNLNVLTILVSVRIYSNGVKPFTECQTLFQLWEGWNSTASYNRKAS